MGKKSKRRISASGIKAFEDCSWKYWTQTIKRLPDLKNEGAIRGTICHLVLELLLRKKHKDLVEPILKSGSIDVFPAVDRLVIKHLKANKILTVENHKLCDKMILVALQNDFFCEGGDLQDPEFRFHITNDKPEFEAKGFIDKMAFYQDGTVCKIIDYKTSKFKLSGEDKEANNQAFLYSWAIKKLFKKVKHVAVEFLFLKFSQAPRQIIEPTDLQLKGFVHYVGFVNKQIQNLNEEKAKMNFAAHSPKNSWLCGKGAWVCPYRDAFEYYAIVDASGDIRYSNRDKKKLDPSKGKIKKFYYAGCPAHKNQGGL